MVVHEIFWVAPMRSFCWSYRCQHALHHSALTRANMVAHRLDVDHRPAVVPQTEQAR
jgi:hypothetical protein